METHKNNILEDVSAKKLLFFSPNSVLPAVLPARDSLEKNWKGNVPVREDSSLMVDAWHLH